MQNRMSNIPNVFIRLMVQLCSEVSTVKPVVKLLKMYFWHCHVPGSQPILTMWKSPHITDSLGQTHTWCLLLQCLCPKAVIPEKGINRNSKMQSLQITIRVNREKYVKNASVVKMPEHLHCSQEILLSQSMKMNLGGKNTKWGGGSRKQKRYKNKETKEITGKKKKNYLRKKTRRTDLSRKPTL